jgi:nitroreductase
MNLPENIEPIALLPIGYPIENKPPLKKRKALNAIVFEDQYGQKLVK